MEDTPRKTASILVQPDWWTEKLVNVFWNFIKMYTKTKGLSSHLILLKKDSHMI